MTDYNLKIMKLEKEQIPQSRTTHIFSIDLLRIWLCFEVVLIHFWIYNNNENIFLDFFSWNTSIAVGCFMFVSFLLTAPYLTKWTYMREKLPKRLIRLSIPIIFWAVAYYIYFLLAHIFLNVEFNPSPSNILIQIITGHSYNKPMWFINDLLYLTLLFLPILALKNKNAKVIILITLTVFSLILQHLGYTGKWFGDMNEIISYPLGRFVEQLPYAASALLFELLYIKQKILNHRLWSFALFLIISIVLAYFVKIPVAYSFGSAGLRLLIISISVAMMCYLIPNRIFIKSVANVTNSIAKYSLGIYCTHIMVGYTIQVLFLKLHLQQNTFSMCIIIFILCYIFCRIIALLPYNWCKGAVS